MEFCFYYFFTVDKLIGSPVPSKIKKEDKKKIGTQAKIFTSTPRSILKKSVKFADNPNDRIQTVPADSVPLNLSNESARTIVYRSGSKRITKRRDTMQM